MTDFEGNRDGWHIRLSQRVTLPDQTVETWQLFFKDQPESSPMPKSIALDWMHTELKTGNTGTDWNAVIRDMTGGKS
jgi:hypothetical protein